jgi:hypothetical protein
LPKDDDLLPKKSKSAPKAQAAPARSGVSPQMLRVIQVTRGIGLLFGGFVTLVAFMSVVGLVTDNFWARLLIALLVVIGLPAFAADRLLKRTKLGGGMGMVVDVFAIVYLALALLFVAGDFASKPLFVKEGDRYARSGSRGMARFVYWLGGVSPVFPDEKGAAAPGSASASSSTSPPAASSR